MTRLKSSDLTAKGKAKKAAIMPPDAIKRASVLIGIDPGTHTGIAVKHHGTLQTVETTTIYSAIQIVIGWHRIDFNTVVRVEDARLRTWFGKSGPEVWKGAGSIARDCAIWEEFLTDLKIPFEMVHPKHVKETTADYFKKLTGWQGRTSKHAREAAWLVL